MSVKIPENYTLEPFTNRKVLRSRHYKPWTVGDLREMLADFPDDASVWLTRYDETTDDILIHPLEHFGGSKSDLRGESYVTL